MNIRAFLAFLQDRRAARTAAVTMGSPGWWLIPLLSIALERVTIGRFMLALVAVRPGPGVGYGSFARFFNSANAQPARRPSLVAVESSSLAWSARPASNAVNQRRKRAS